MSKRSCLLLTLQPVRSALHPFISAVDAARFMRASRSITAALLSNYSFIDHVFTYNDDEYTSEEVKRSLAFYGRYGMCILRMCLPYRWNEPLVDAETGRSVLPASLIALSMGGADTTRNYSQREGRRSVAFAEFIKGSDWRGREEAQVWGDGEQHIDRCVRRWEREEDDSCYTWYLFEYAPCIGDFNQPFPPGALPPSLRFLKLNDGFEQSLEVGSIPDSVEVLQFDNTFTLPLEAGHLPASLTHLVFHSENAQPLQPQPGVLPVGLRRLHMSGYHYPLLPGILPSQLRALHLGNKYDHPLPPGAIPATVIHLRLSDWYNHPLQVGSIPEGVVHLQLGHDFNQALLPGVLPASLRELNIGLCFSQPLQPGSLPDGLQLLAFDGHSRFQHSLPPGVIPASMRAVSMGWRYKQQLVAGSMPGSVRWLRLPNVDINGELAQGVLLPTTRVVRWP